MDRRWPPTVQLPSTRRIEEVASRRLIEKSHPAEPVVSTRDGKVLVSFGADTHLLDSDAAAALRDALGDALTRRREFLHTAGTHREDGSYVVERRGADSAGHRKVFDSFSGLERLYGRLPREFTAADVGRTGLTGGRRHMVVRHLAEHPAFDCELTARQPLTATKSEEV